MVKVKRNNFIIRFLKSGYNRETIFFGLFYKHPKPHKNPFPEDTCELFHALIERCFAYAVLYSVTCIKLFVPVYIMACVLMVNIGLLFGINAYAKQSVTFNELIGCLFGILIGVALIIITVLFIIAFLGFVVGLIPSNNAVTGFIRNIKVPKSVTLIAACIKRKTCFKVEYED